MTESASPSNDGATIAARPPVEHRITPNPAADTSAAASPSVELCYFEWGAAREGQPSWVFCHATGFHARCWDQVVAGLPATAHVIAIDMRGHGRSAKQGPYDWDNFANDVCALIETLDIPSIVGVGHSMGGNAITQAAARLPERFERLVLVDPVIMDPEMLHLASGAAVTDPLDHPVSRRKDRFASWQAMYERFVERAPYSLWRQEVLRDYCRYGVLPADEGDGGEGVTLACPAVVEASVYVGTTRSDVRPLLPRVTMPVAVLRARPREEGAGQMDFSASPTWPKLAQQLPNAQDIFLPELTHFIAMQVPELVTYAALHHVSARAQIESLLQMADKSE